MNTLSSGTLWQDLGFQRCRPFYLDARFLLAILAGIIVLSAGRGILSGLVPSKIYLSVFLIFNTLVWYPLMEEVLFRGIIQGQLTRKEWATQRFLNLTLANWVTSIVFACFHLLHHAPHWALLILFPSLVFGYFRDSYKSILPALVLHIFYNLQFMYFTS